MKFAKTGSTFPRILNSLPNIAQDFLIFAKVAKFHLVTLAMGPWAFLTPNKSHFVGQSR